MKILFAVLFSLVIINTTAAQNLQIEKEYNSSYYVFNDAEVNLTPEKISITKNNQNIYAELLIGKKVFKSSPADNFFLVSNYQFLDSKEDYPVDIKVFDRNGKLAFTFQFLAPFDLPHPLVNLNDNGVLALFDLLSFKVKLINQGSENEIELEKEAPFEIERAAFVEMNDDFVFILTSQNVLDITESQANVKLYKINLSDLRVDKKELDYNTPTLLKIEGSDIYISGVKFQDIKLMGKTIKFDFDLNELASNNKIIEQLSVYNKKLFGKYYNAIYKINEDLSISSEKHFSDNERIVNLFIDDTKLIVITNILGQYHLYSFLPDLRLDFNAALGNFGVSKIEDVSVSENHIIIRHDSKSIKLIITRN